MREPIRPSVWRSAKRNTALRVRAVRIARREYQGCPPRVVRGSAPPRLDRLSGEPDRQAPTLAEAGVIGGPVRDFVLLPGNMMTAGLVQLEGQGWGIRGHTRNAVLRHPALRTNQSADPCNTAPDAVACS